MAIVVIERAVFVILVLYVGVLGGIGTLLDSFVDAVEAIVMDIDEVIDMRTVIRDNGLDSMEALVVVVVVDNYKDMEQNTMLNVDFRAYSDDNNGIVRSIEYIKTEKFRMS